MYNLKRHNLKRGFLSGFGLFVVVVAVIGISWYTYTHNIKQSQIDSVVKIGDFQYTKGESYLTAKQTLADNSWIPTTSGDTFISAGDKEFPEIDCHNSAICKVYFHKGDYTHTLKVQRGLGDIHGWVVVGDEK